MASRVNLPNAITAFRVALTPLVAWLLFRPSGSARLLAFAVFLVAALSDLLDGILARRRGEITDFGKLVDPIADKLLLVATLLPFWWLTTRRPELAGLPLVDDIPLWIVLVFLGREALITGLRMLSARRGIVLAAGRSGKRKAFLQNVFSGCMILWMAWRSGPGAAGGGGRGTAVDVVLGWATAATLIGALVLTLYSMAVYLLAFRAPPRRSRT